MKNLKRDRGFYKKYIDIPCPLGCGKKIKGTSKKQWLMSFTMHLIGKEHRIWDRNEQKRIVDDKGKNAIKNL